MRGWLKSLTLSLSKAEQGGTPLPFFEVQFQNHQILRVDDGIELK